MRKPEIAVTGMGCITALGNSVNTCVDNLFAGKVNCTREPKHLNIDHPDRYPVFEVDDTQVAFLEEYLLHGRTAQLALAASMEAANQSGLSRASEKKVGVCIGTTVGNAFNIEHLYTQFRERKNPDTFELERYFKSNPAELVADYFGARGPVMAVSNACSSGTDAIGLAMSWLQQDLCDIVIAGGADELNHISYLGFSSLLINSQTPPKPFDKDRSGLNLGEGAAILILEKARPAKQNRALLTEYVTACDQYHPTAPHPDGRGLRETLDLLTKDIKIDDLAFINAHGTGTGENDRVEMRVLKEMFPETDYFSVKGATGHTLGAAGAIEAVITVACFEQNRIPASIGFTSVDPEFNLSPVKTNTSLAAVQYAVSQSVAFGGNNSTLLFRKA